MCFLRSRISLRQPADLRIDHRLAAADRNDRRAAFVHRCQALLDGQHFVDRGLVFADAAAARAGQVAGVQRLEHHHQRKLLRAATCACVATYPAMFAVILNGYLIHYPQSLYVRLMLDLFAGICKAKDLRRPLRMIVDSAPARTAEKNSGRNDISGKTHTEIRCR